MSKALKEGDYISGLFFPNTYFINGVFIVKHVKAYIPMGICVNSPLASVFPVALSMGGGEAR